MDLGNAAQAGGVSVAIADILRRRGGLWFGWSGETAEPGSTALTEPRWDFDDGIAAIATVALTADDHRDYYLGYSNSVLWPVFHNRLDLAQLEGGFFARYCDVNRRFAEALFPLLQPTDTIWIHDYHLILLARELRRLGAKNPIGFFLHIPVPPAEAFLAIPEHRELARALTAYDLVGLQTSGDARKMIDFLEQGVAGRILSDGRIRVFGEELIIRSIPVSIDLADFSPDPPRRIATLPDVQRIVGVDRLDYSKGLPNKFRAFGRFLDKYPEYRGRVVLSQIAPPTRESLEAYSDIREELQSLAGEINGRFGELEWMPIHYIHRTTPRAQLPPLLRSSRIGLITPLRDGMNLVAKEYVAAQDPDDPGVLILSRFAGAAEELGDALLVNPYDLDEIAEALKIALELPLEERRERHAALLAAVTSHDTFAWARTFLEQLELAHEQFGSGGGKMEAAMDAAVSALRRSFAHSKVSNERIA